MISEYKKVRLLYQKSFPAGIIGIVASIYGKGPGCEVELWDENGYSVDVVTFTFEE